MFRTIRNIKRLKEIVDVLFKEGLGYLIERLKLKKYLRFHKRVQVEKFGERYEGLPVKLRRAMENLGGAFVKLGQLLSLRPDLIPKDFCEEFSKLQDEVKPLHFNVVKKVIEKEFKRPIFTIFAEFEKEPIASASVGQVHKAKLKTGETVVVKVQRPNIRKVFDADISLLYYIARLAEKHFPELRNYNLVGIVKEFEDYTKDELNYFVEASNIDRFYKNFQNDPEVVIPKVYFNYTTERVLVMEFIDGVKIKDLKDEDYKNLKTTRKKVLEKINKAFLKQILEFGFFHADPHPGNILVLKNGKIAFLDFGIVGRITADLKEKIEDALIGLVKPDSRLLAEALIDVGAVEDVIDIEKLRTELALHFEKYYGISIEEANVGMVFYDMFSFARKFNIKFPTDFVLLAKALATMSGLNEEYYPEYNFVEICKPEIEKLLKKRTSPTYLYNYVRENIHEIKRFFKAIPKDAKGIINLVKKGINVNVDVENRDVREFTKEIDRSSFRLTYGLLISSLIIAAFLTLVAKQPPIFLGMPLLGIICIVIALILAFALLISIVKGLKGGENI